jgi:hypothetical protein
MKSIKTAHFLVGLGFTLVKQVLYHTSSARTAIFSMKVTEFNITENISSELYDDFMLQMKFLSMEFLYS